MIPGMVPLIEVVRYWKCEVGGLVPTVTYLEVER